MAESFSKKLIPLLRAIDPLFTPEVEAIFRSIYGTSSERAISILRERLGIISFVVEKSELGLDEPILQTITLELKNSERYHLSTISADMRAFIVDRLKYYDSHQTEHHQQFMAYLDQFQKSLRSPEEIQVFLNYREDLEIIRTQFKATLSANQEMLTRLGRVNRYERAKIMPWFNNPEDRKLFSELKTIYKYVKLKIQGECLAQVMGVRRRECYQQMALAVNYLEGMSTTTKKTIVFTSYVEIVDSLAEKLRKDQLVPLIVHGKAGISIHEAIKKFNEDANVNPLIATYKSLSTGVQLTAADVMYIIDPPFRDYILTQAISRIHRLGATTQCKVYFLELNTGEAPNIASRTMDILKWSQKEVSNILGISMAYDLNVSEAEGISLEGFDVHTPYQAPQSLTEYDRLKGW